MTIVMIRHANNNRVVQVMAFH